MFNDCFGQYSCCTSCGNQAGSCCCHGNSPCYQNHLHRDATLQSMNTNLHLPYAPQQILSRRQYETTYDISSQMAGPTSTASGTHSYIGSSPSSKTVDERADRSRATEIDRKIDRQWVALTAYQPIDTVVKTMEVPVVRKIETYVPKVIVEEKVVEVPKYVDEFVDKFVEIPEITEQNKIVEEIEYQQQYKYVKKPHIFENIIQKPKIEKKYIEKVVYVPEFKEVVRYNYMNTVEEVIKYVPKSVGSNESLSGKSNEDRGESSSNRAVDDQYITQSPGHAIPINGDAIHSGYNSSSTSAVPDSYRSTDINGVPFEGYPSSPFVDLNIPKVEHVFKPKVVQTVEIQKQVPISVDVPVPYMVPKPVVIPVQVPILKFRDHFVPVPVRRRIIPRIRWTNEIYEVECIKEKPFLQVQDVIKPVPCDVEINVHEFVEKAMPINPAEISQADIHGMWMRVNADLADAKKIEYGDAYPYVKHPDGTVFGEPGCSGLLEGSGGDSDVAEVNGNLEVQQENENKVAVDESLKCETMSQKDSKEQQETDIDKNDWTSMQHTESAKGVERHDTNQPKTVVFNPPGMVALHPDHPLAMTYLQNQWIQTATNRTHEIYSPEWFEAHQRGLYSLQSMNPSQVHISVDQLSNFQPQHEPAFGKPPWFPQNVVPAHPPLNGRESSTNQNYTSRIVPCCHCCSFPCCCTSSAANPANNSTGFCHPC